LIAPPNY